MWRGNKDREFWETLDSEVLILMKIWMEKKNWGKVKEKLERKMEGAGSKKEEQERKSDEKNDSES